MSSETLNNFGHHHLQNDFHCENRLNQMFLIFLIHFQLLNVLFCFSWFFDYDFSVYHQNLSIFVTKFAFGNLTAKFSAASLLNSGVVIYLSWLWLVILFSVSVIFVL